MNDILIAGFGAIGKTKSAKKHKNIIDLKYNNFKHIIDDQLNELPVEERKEQYCLNINVQ